MKFLLRLYIIVCAALWPLALPAQAETAGDTLHAVAEDSVQVSLLTCSPGELVYELYGHTALRVRELRGGVWSDWVFNYGTFSFEQSHFMWRFMLGETDYELGVVPYSLFYNAYVREERGLYEQRLRLTQPEARRLVAALATNLRPENATYRYNFFYDNCVTRAIDRIEQAVDGKVVWPAAGDGGKTLRDIVHEYSAVSPWNCFGQDLLLGAEADRPASLRHQMFAPMYAEKFLSQARVVRDGQAAAPLSDPVLTLLPPQSGAQGGAFPLTPKWAFGILLALTAALCVAEWRGGKYYWLYDALLLLAQGVAGCIISFLFFFSSHPAVGSNWLIVLFNPLPLLFFAWLMRDASRGHRSWGMYVQPVLLVLTLAFGLAGVQNFPPEVYLIVLTLALRVAAHFHTPVLKASKSRKVIEKNPV